MERKHFYVESSGRLNGLLLDCYIILLSKEDGNRKRKNHR